MSRFRLQRILHLRRLIEQQRQAEFGRWRQKFQAQQNALDRLRAQTTSHTRRMAALGPQTAGAVLRHYAYLSCLQADIREAEAAVRRTAEVLSEKRARLLQAHRERKVLERLRERHAAEAVRQALKREQRELDELNVIRVGRTNPEEAAA